MTNKAPVPGMIVRYGFLWPVEQAEGRSNPRKYRPCMILAAEKKADGSICVVVAPISHTRPYNKSGSLRVPRREMNNAGLDTHMGDKWLYINQVNVFTWPGLHLQNRPRKKTHEYGMVSKDFFKAAKAKMAKIGLGRIRAVQRDPYKPMAY